MQCTSLLGNFWTNPRKGPGTRTNNSKRVKNLSESGEIQKTWENAPCFLFFLWVNVTTSFPTHVFIWRLSECTNNTSSLLRLKRNPIWINAEHTGKEFVLPVSKANILFLGTWWDWWNCVYTRILQLNSTLNSQVLTSSESTENHSWGEEIG